MNNDIRKQLAERGLEPFLEPITFAQGIAPNDMYLLHNAYVSKRALCELVVSKINYFNNLRVPIFLWDGHFLTFTERQIILSFPECQARLSAYLHQLQYELETDTEGDYVHTGNENFGDDDDDDGNGSDLETVYLTTQMRNTSLSNAKAHQHPTKIGKVLHEWGAGHLKTGRKNKAGKQTRTVPHTKAGQKQAIAIGYAEARRGKK